MGVLDGKLGDVDAGSSRAADMGGLSPEEAAEFRRMENGGVDNGDNGGVDDPPPDDGQQDEPGFEDRADTRGDDGDEIDPHDQPLRLPGDRREQLNADDDDGEADGQVDPDSDLPKLGDKQQTVSAGRFRREMKALHDKLVAERAKNTGADPALAQQLQQEKIEKAKLETRLTMVLDAINSSQKRQQQEQEVDDDPEPDADEAPFEHGKWLSRELKRQRAENQALRQGVQKTEQAQTSAQESQAFEQSYVLACQEYAAQDETFGLAYTVVKNSAYAEIADSKFGKDLYSADPANRLTPQETQAVLAEFRRREQAIATAELQANRDPALKIMRMARARGFDPEGAKKALAAHKEQQQNGGKQPPAAGKQSPQQQRQEERSATDHVRDLQKRKAGSKSLSDGGSAPTNGQLTLRQVAGMSDRDFQNLLNKLDRSEIDEALLGKESA